MMRRWLSWRLLGVARRLNPDMFAAIISTIESEPRLCAMLVDDYNRRFPVRPKKDLV